MNLNDWSPNVVVLISKGPIVWVHRMSMGVSKFEPRLYQWKQRDSKRGSYRTYCVFFVPWDVPSYTFIRTDMEPQIKSMVRKITLIEITHGFWNPLFSHLMWWPVIFVWIFEWIHWLSPRVNCLRAGLPHRNSRHSRPGSWPISSNTSLCFIDYW